MKYIKTYEKLHKGPKEDIENIIYFNVVVDLDITYLNDGDKDYDRIINQDSIKDTAKKLTDFMKKILYFDEQEYKKHYNNILDYLDEIEIHEADDLNEIDEDSLDYVTQEIYDYINEYSNYELEEKYEIYKSSKKYNL